MNIRPQIQGLLLVLPVIVLCEIWWSDPLHAQGDRQAVLLKDGREFVGVVLIDTVPHYVIHTSDAEIRRVPVRLSTLMKGRNAEPDTIIYQGAYLIGSVEPIARGFVQVRTDDGTLIVMPVDSVADVSSIHLVREAPNRRRNYGSLEAPISWDCGRVTRWYFLELRMLGILYTKFGAGGEIAGGFRLGDLGLGAGISFITTLDVVRMPLFVHARYQFAGGCVRPFAVLDAGYIVDNLVSRYKLSPGLRLLTAPGPKMLGAGAGLDFAISPSLDFSFDLGYRYLTVAGERPAPACDPVMAVAYSEVHSAYLRLGLTF